MCQYFSNCLYSFMHIKLNHQFHKLSQRWLSQISPSIWPQKSLVVPPRMQPRSGTNSHRVKFLIEIFQLLYGNPAPCQTQHFFCRSTCVCLATKCSPSPRGFPTLAARQTEYISTKDAIYINTQVITRTNFNLY